jgi:small-conductance mechanosensitive channel
METLQRLAPSLISALLVGIGLFVLHRFVLQVPRHIAGQRFRNQSIMLLGTALGVLLVFLFLPIQDELRGHILSLVGIIVSAAIALSSTTLLGNAMAALMIHTIRGFRVGDFITVEQHFGRVTEVGLFHTEIQTPDRDLTTLPNLFLVTHAVRTIRHSGTIVSATVSLGYDVPRQEVDPLLAGAAKDVGLTDPFVQILDLGDFSVTYRVAGLLEEVKNLLTVRSLLRAAMMDALHGAGIEIVSPRVQINRDQPKGERLLAPVSPGDSQSEPHSAPERVVFDKAEAAASIEELRIKVEELDVETGKLESALAEQSAEMRQHTEGELERVKQHRKHLVAVIQAREEGAKRKE